jgi:urea transport system substrate-binding protein
MGALSHTSLGFRRVALSLAVVLAVVMIVDAPHGTPAAAQSKGVTLGFVTNLSGNGALFGEPAYQGVQLAVEEINKAGGVLGGPMTLRFADDATDPNVAKQAWETLVNQHVQGIVAEETSASRVAGVPVAEKANLPAIYATESEGGECSPILYLNAAVDPQKTPSFVDFLMKQSGGNTFFLLGTDYNYPRGAFAIAKKAIEKAGGRVVGEEYTPFNTPDYSTIINKLRTSGAKILFLAVVGGPDNVAFFKQARGAGIKMTKGGMTAGSMSLDDATLKAVGAAAEGTYMDSGYFSSINTPENKKFLAAMRRKFGGNMKVMGFLSQPSYDAVHLFALAFKRAGTTEPKAVLKALSEVEFNGPRGPIKMTPDRHATLTIYIAQATREATYKVIKSLPNQIPPKQCPELPFGMK